MEDSKSNNPISAATWQEEIVLNFIKAYRDSWPADLAAADEPLAEDAYYQIVVPTIKPTQGHANILREHELMRERGDQKHEMKAMGSKGNFVFMERVDYSLYKGKWTPVPLVAVFEVNDAGKISAWREYLDLANTAYQHGITVEDLCHWHDSR